MKVRVEIECTPQEARALLGLPDVEPLQAAMMKGLEQRMGSAMTFLDPEQLARQWAPLGLQSLEQFQKLLWGAAARAVSTPEEKPAEKKPAEKKEPAKAP